MGTGFAAQLQHLHNPFEYIVDFIEYLVVPEPQYTETGAFQKECSRRICFHRFHVLAAVYLNHDFPFKADKIQNEISKWVLAPKLAPIELPHAKMPP